MFMEGIVVLVIMYFWMRFVFKLIIPRCNSFRKFIWYCMLGIF